MGTQEEWLQLQSLQSRRDSRYYLGKELSKSTLGSLAQQLEDFGRHSFKMNVLERLDSFRDEEFHLGPMVPLKQQLELDKVSELCVLCVTTISRIVPPQSSPEFSF